MKKNKFIRVVIIVFVIVTAFQLGRQVFKKEEWAARNFVYDQVKSTFSTTYTKVSARYGIRAYGDPKADLSTVLTKPVIVLIHGLDEPGRVWLNLAPVLNEKGYPVFFMSYPNDQKVTASARLFFEALKGMGIHPENRLVIIGHSMGGLVSREMLTAPQIDYMGAAAPGRVPRVSDLIMVGTPNHGSQLARFRFFMEIRDQVQNLFEKDTHWLQGLLDGTGAAGIDLTPGSDFLSVLNNRPHPPGVNLHVVAGIVSPWTGADIHGFARTMENYLPSQKHGEVNGLEKALNRINSTIGDGLVTLDSARLEDIPLIQVGGSHLTMIRNLNKSSKRMPPAIPVILGILEKRQE